MSDYCTLFSQTLLLLLFTYLTITDVTWYVHYKFPVSFLLYIATKKNLRWPNTVLARAFADVIQHVHKDFKKQTCRQ